MYQVSLGAGKAFLMVRSRAKPGSKDGLQCNPFPTEDKLRLLHRCGVWATLRHHGLLRF